MGTSERCVTFRLSLTRAALTAGLAIRVLRFTGAKDFESGWAKLDGVSAAESGSLRGIFEGGCDGADSGSADNSGVVSAIILFRPEADSAEPSVS